MATSPQMAIFQIRSNYMCFIQFVKGGGGGRGGGVVNVRVLTCLPAHL